MINFIKHNYKITVETRFKSIQGQSEKEKLTHYQAQL